MYPSTPDFWDATPDESVETMFIDLAYTLRELNLISNKTYSDLMDKNRQQMYYRFWRIKNAQAQA